MPSNGLLNEERRREILGVLHRDGRVLVKDLARQFRISQITIRKGPGVSRRPGGHPAHSRRRSAGASRCAARSNAAREREDSTASRRRRLPAPPCAWWKRVSRCCSIPERRPRPLRAPSKTWRQLTVITNAINIAAELAGTHIEVILTGGMLRKNSFSLVGPLAERTLRQLSADILFLGVDGFDTKAGLFTPNLLESEVNRAMVEIARRTIAVCDSSKFGRRSLCNIMPVSAVHEVITDKQIPKADLRALKDAGVKVTLV